MDHRTREQIKSEADYAKGIKAGKESGPIDSFFYNLLSCDSPATKAGYKEGRAHKGE